LVTKVAERILITKHPQYFFKAHGGRVDMIIKEWYFCMIQLIQKKELMPSATLAVGVILFF